MPHISPLLAHINDSTFLIPLFHTLPVRFELKLNSSRHQTRIYFMLHQHISVFSSHIPRRDRRWKSAQFVCFDYELVADRNLLHNQKHLQSHSPFYRASQHLANYFFTRPRNRHPCAPLPNPISLRVAPFLPVTFKLSNLKCWPGNLSLPLLYFPFLHFTSKPDRKMLAHNLCRVSRVVIARRRWL